MEQEMLQKFIKYAKDEFGFDIEVKESPGKDSFKEIFGISFLEEKEYFDLVDINSLNYDNEDSLEINKEKSNLEIDKESSKYELDKMDCYKLVA